MIKKISLLLLSFMCLPVLAQLHKSVVYDFNNPQKLNPSITPREVNGGVVNVTSRVFQNGPVSISFVAGPQPIGAQIFTFVDDFHSSTSYFLRITSTTTMTVATSGEVVLDSIRISNESTIGDLHLVTGEPGELDAYQMYKFWSSGIKDCKSVSFTVSSHPSQIQRMTVYYTTPSAIMLPTKVSLSDGETLASFSSMSLTFASDMKVQNGDAIKLVNTATNKPLPVIVTANGKVATLKVADPIIKDGEFTVTIPAGTFVDGEGYENKDLTYSFKVYAPRDVLAFTNVKPQQGSVISLGNPITLSFSEDVKLDKEAKAITLLKEGQVFTTLTLSVNPENPREVLIRYPDNVTIDNGTYSISIPAKTIHNSHYDTEDAATEDRYNAKINLQWSVDKSLGDSEIMKAAKALLANTDYQGLGYPAADSKSRTELQQLTEAEHVPSDEALTAAIGAFYNESDVTMPVSDSYYKVVGVNAGGKKIYLAYKNNTIVLTTTASEAVPFMVKIVSGNTVTLQTRDGKYLHVLTAPFATGTNLPNVTDAYDAKINNLTLTKLKVEGADSTSTLGLFSLSGVSIVDKQTLVYSRLNYTTNAIANPESIVFNNDISCAFVLEKTNRYTDVQAEDANCALSTTLMENTDKPILTFSGVDALTLENAKAAYLTTKAGAKVSTSAAQLLTAVKDDKTSFAVDVTGLADGDYVLVIPQNTLLYNKDGKTFSFKEIKKEFTIKFVPKFKYEFGFVSFVQDKGVDTPVTDESLNDMIVFIQVGVPYSGLIPDESKTVRLAFYDDDSTIRTGHFVSYSNENFEKDWKKYHPNEDVPSNVQAIKLILNSPIKLGELKPGRYSFVFEQATFGDANFGKYLKDKSVPDTACLVNNKFILSQLVNNDAAIPKYPSDAVLAAAKALLQKSGVGYPSSSSSARKALQSLVDSGKGDDSEYNAAMNAFYSDSSVELPSAGKYYTIAGVTSNNKVAYLQYDGTNVTLTADAAKATGFKVSLTNSTLNFQTGDGKYLHTLMTSDNYTGTSKSNVTTTLDAVNNLLVVRLGSISGVDAKNTMGLFSMFGSMGKDANGKPANGYSLVNAATAAIQAPSSSLTSFSETLTNGFRFAEIDKAKIPVPAVKYAVSPVDKAELLSLNKVTLTFSYPGNLTVADKSKVTLKDAAGKAVTISDVALASGSQNTVQISFSNLAAGTYTLTAAKGAFTYTFAETKREVAEIKATYTVAAKPELKYTLVPATGTKLEELSSVTLAFTSPANATLKDAAKITLVDANKKAIAVQAKAVDGKQGTFTVSFDKLVPGTYTLTAAKGAFTYTLAGTAIEIDAISATYTVEAAADVKWALSPAPGDYETLNGLTLTFTSNKDIALADQSKITLKDTLGEPVTLKEITKDGNKFAISFDKLGSGSYTFEAAKGAFTYTFVGKTEAVDAIKAQYTVLPVPEVAAAVYPATNSKFETLSSVRLTFTCTKSIELADQSKVKLTDANGKAVELKGFGVKDNVYTVTFDELPSGDYTFSVEKGAFVFTFGGEQIEVDGINAVSFTIVPLPVVTWTLTPESGSKLESLSSVRLNLKADRSLTLADKSKVTLTDATGKVVPIEIKGSQNVYTVTFDEMTTPGEYTLTAAKGAFTFQFGGKSVAVGTISAKYNVAEPRPSEAVMAEAKDVLTKTGMGYPKADSKTRLALAQLVDDGRGYDEVFLQAISDYLAETDVEMPAADKYYHIVAVKAAKGTAYVNLKGDLTGLVDDETEATPLKLTKGEEKDAYVLTTADGQWQQNVTIAKKADAENAGDVFGLFSISLFDKLEAIGYTFAEVDHTTIPVPVVECVLTPESGSELDVLDKVTLAFTGYDKISLTDATKIELVKGETTMNPVSVAPVEGSTHDYVLTFGIDEPGSYMLLVGKGAFTFTYADLTHETEAMTAKFTVKVPRPTEETLMAAKALLEKTGIGTPAADSKARTALTALVELGEGKDEVFQQAMADFVAETDVEQPADGKFYRVVAVAAKGVEGYVTYEKGQVALTADAEQPAVGVFRVKAGEDGTLTLAAYDGQYECQVHAARLNVEGMEADETFGLFSLQGTLGGSTPAYARVGVENGEWEFMNSTQLDKRLGLTFDEEMTTAFRFTEVAEEDLVLPEVTLAFTPDGGSVDYLDELTLSFDVPFPVTLKDQELISLKDEDGNTVPFVSVKTDANVCQLTLVNVVAGTYTLEAGEGAFTYNFYDKEIAVKADSKTFTVLKGADFVYDFNVGDVACKLDGEEGQEYFKDTDLSTLTVGFKEAVTMNPDKSVLLLDEIGAIIAIWHLELVEDTESEYKFAPDVCVPEGILKAGTYTFAFEEGLFGDGNYAAYLLDPMSVRMADCHVNKQQKVLSVKVDNEIATGVVELSAGNWSKVKCYDLNGRRVHGKPQKGRVYIVNGKKVTF